MNKGEIRTYELKKEYNLELRASLELLKDMNLSYLQCTFNFLEYSVSLGMKDSKVFTFFYNVEKNILEERTNLRKFFIFFKIKMLKDFKIQKIDYIKKGSLEFMATMGKSIGLIVN